MVVNLSNVVIIWRSSKSALKTLRRGPPERGQKRHYGIDFQTAENHLEHVGEFDGSRQMGIIGHGSDFPESSQRITKEFKVIRQDYIHEAKLNAVIKAIRAIIPESAQEDYIKAERIRI